MDELISRKAVLALAKDICVPTKDGEYRHRSIDPIDVMELSSAEPEQKNRKTALSVQVKVEFDDMKALLEDIGNLQTYKLFEGDDMVLANIKDIKGILTKHVKAKEVQPERKKGKWVDGLPYVNSHWWVCSVCHVSAPENHTGYNFCPSCGADMRGEQ